MFSYCSINRESFKNNSKEYFFKQNSNVFKTCFKSPLELKEGMHILYSFLFESENTGLEIMDGIRIGNYYYPSYKIFGFRFVINEAKDCIYTYDHLKVKGDNYTRYYSAGNKTNIKIRDYRNYFREVYLSFKDKLVFSELELDKKSASELAFFIESIWNQFIKLENIFLQERTRDVVLMSSFSIENTLNRSKHRILSGQDYILLKIDYLKLDSIAKAKKLKDIIGYYFRSIETNLKNHFHYQVQNNPYWIDIKNFMDKLEKSVLIDEVKLELLQKEFIFDKNPIYLEILHSIYDFYHQSTLNPEIYEKRGENSLRSIIIPHLNLLFRSKNLSATAESLNGKGKNDIQVSKSGEVLFIGECKIWSDKTKFKEAIDQLFGYLTSKDKRGCLINFYKKMKFETYLGKKNTLIQSHPNFSVIQEKITTDNTFISYKFIHPKFKHEVIIDFLSFHFPD